MTCGLQKGIWKMNKSKQRSSAVLKRNDKDRITGGIFLLSNSAGGSDNSKKTDLARQTLSPWSGPFSARRV